MLIATQAKSIAGTLKYFDKVLTQGDYYLGQEVSGTWRGEGCELLGLEPEATVTREQFGNLLAGLHPITGQQLVQRLRKDRRPGVDFTYSVPKSVSIAWAVKKDERIIEAVRAAVHETMTRDVEPRMCRRVRTGKQAATKGPQADRQAALRRLPTQNLSARGGKDRSAPAYPRLLSELDLRRRKTLRGGNGRDRS